MALSLLLHAAALLLIARLHRASEVEPAVEPTSIELISVETQPAPAASQVDEPAATTAVGAASPEPSEGPRPPSPRDKRGRPRAAPTAGNSTDVVAEVRAGGAPTRTFETTLGTAIGDGHTPAPAIDLAATPSVTGPQHRGSSTVPALPPRPLGDYSDWKKLLPARLRGRRIVLALAIDTDGRVDGVRVVNGVEPEWNLKAIAFVRTVRFAPARDERGRAVAGSYGWVFVIR